MKHIVSLLCSMSVLFVVALPLFVAIAKVHAELARLCAKQKQKGKLARLLLLALMVLHFPATSSVTVSTRGCAPPDR